MGAKFYNVMFDKDVFKLIQSGYLIPFSKITIQVTRTKSPYARDDPNVQTIML